MAGLSTNMEIVLLFVKQYWRIFAYLALIAAAYVKGCSDESDRFDEFKTQLRATQAEQARWSAARTKTQQEISAQSGRETTAALTALRSTNDSLARELLKRPSGGQQLPSLPKPAPGDKDPSTVCFQRDKLDEGIRAAVGRFQESRDKLLRGSLEVLQRGDEKVVTLVQCEAWAAEQEKLNRR